MTETWDGYPENPERDGWHWLASSEGPVPALWARPAWRHCRDFWIPQAEPEWMVRQGWRYLGPCLTPAEVYDLVSDAVDEIVRNNILEARNYDA